MKTNSQDIFDEIARNFHLPEKHVIRTDEELEDEEIRNQDLVEAAEETGRAIISKGEAKRGKYRNFSLGAHSNFFLSSLFPEV